MKKEIIEMTKEYQISIVQIDEERWDIAVMHNKNCELLSGRWEIDYSKFNDVFTARSSMEVYGIIKHEIVPAYYDKTGFEWT